MKITKKLLVLLFLFFFIFDVSIYLIYFLISINEIKCEGEERVLNSRENNENVEVIILDKNLFNTSVDFIKHNEMNYKGDMYDVVKIEEYDNNIHIYCIKDEKETKFLNNYERLISDTKNKVKTTRLTLISFFFLGIVNCTIDYSNIDFIISSLITKDKLINNYITPISPPPKFFIT